MEHLKSKGTKIGLLEFGTERQGLSFGKKDAILLGIAIFGLVFFWFVTIPSLGTPGSRLIGILIFNSFGLACGGISNAIVALLTMVWAVLMGISTWGGIATKIGTSPLIMLLCMFTLANGVISTNLGQRITYTFVKKLGRSARGLILAILVSSCVLSMFIVNLPLLVVMVPIVRGLLTELEQKPGESRLGTAAYFALLVGATLGGASLMSGSGANPTVVALLETASEGAYTITYAQWALCGVPTAIVLVPVIWVLICLVFGIDKKYPLPDKAVDYAVQKMNELGKADAAEIRFVITLMISMALFLFGSMIGFSTPMVCIVSLALCGCPGWGVINVKTALSKANWEVILTAMCTMLFGTYCAQTGFAEWMVNGLLGWAVNIPTLVMVIIVGGVCVIVTFVTCANANEILVPGMVAFAALSGGSPIPLCLACAMAAPGTQHVPWHYTTLVTCDSGYWTYKDFLRAGWISQLVYVPVAAVMITVMTMLVC